MSAVCPDCGVTLNYADALGDHRGDPFCLAEQDRSKTMQDLKDGWRRAGTTWATLQKSGVPFKYLPFGFTDNRPHEPTVRADYVRCAPAWAVWVSELTGFTPNRRVMIIKHCLQHKSALEAVQAAGRLGFVRKMTKGTPLKSDKRKAASDFFRDIMKIRDADKPVDPAQPVDDEWDDDT